MSDLMTTLLASAIAGKAPSTAGDLDAYNKTEIDSMLSKKVDKVSGKGLSTNDFTNAYKTKLDGLENYDDTVLETAIGGLTRDVNTLYQKIATLNSTMGYQAKNHLSITQAPPETVGVSFHITTDGLIVLSGTATADKDIYLPEYPYSATEADTWIYINKDSVISCYGSLGDIKIAFYPPNVEEYVYSNMYYVSVTPSSPSYLFEGSIVAGIYIRVSSGVDYTDRTVSVMIRDVDIEDNEYAPYIPTVDERCKVLENQIIMLDSMEDYNALTSKTADYYFIREG